MALSEELPIYKATYDLLEKMIELSKELPKFYRYTLGTRMVDLCLDILEQVYRANMSKDKRTNEIEELIINYRLLLLLLRVCYKEKVFQQAGMRCMYSCWIR